MSLKDLLTQWDQEAQVQNKALQMEVGTAMLPLLQMIDSTRKFDVDTHENDPDACIVKLHWGNFVVSRIPDQGDMKGMWMTYFPIACEEHGIEWVPFPLASTLPHMLRTGLINTLNQYMSKELGEIMVPPGVTKQ